jgi:ankyrin repeat protein
MTDLEELLGTRGLNDVINPSGWTQLIFNSRSGDLNAVNLLLMAGADVNILDQEGVNAVHYAAGQGHDQILAALLKAGGNARHVAPDGRTALHRAAGNGKPGCIILLLEAGCDPNIVGGPDKLTPVEEAARWEHAECLKELISRGATPAKWMIDGSAPPW